MSALLLVEDDENLRVTLADNLQEEGYLVTAVATFKAAQQALEANKVDLVVLDLMLPDGDGYQLCRDIRAARLPVRVLMLTARTLEDDLVKGFDAGADDYLAKPYRLRELLARVAALLRRGAVARGAPLRRLPPRRGGARGGGPEGQGGPHPQGVRPAAGAARAQGEVLSRDEILDRVWGADVVVDAHTVDNFVSSLKKKLRGDGFELKTVRGVGFKLELG